MFLEAGYDKSREVDRLLWSPKLDGAPVVDGRCQVGAAGVGTGPGLELPSYVEVAREGPDHAPRFTSEVRIKGRKPARGEGASKTCGRTGGSGRAARTRRSWKQNVMPEEDASAAAGAAEHRGRSRCGPDALWASSP